MKYIEALEEYYPTPDEVSLFLAGGITNCYDWQAEVKEALNPYNITLLNPRRKDYNDITASRQIQWEHRHLRRATMIMFWFPHETLCPITLLEYGKCLVGNKTLFVGTDGGYKRREDVLVQTKLERPFQTIHSDIDSVIDSVIQECIDGFTC